MTFFEWLGHVVMTGVVMYVFMMASAIAVAVLNRKGGLEVIALMVYVFIISGFFGFLLALWLVWSVNPFPFLES